MKSVTNLEIKEGKQFLYEILINKTFFKFYVYFHFIENWWKKEVRLRTGSLNDETGKGKV